MEVGRLTGAFDLVTVGQLDVVAQARARCARLHVRVLTDAQVERLDGLAPVMPLDERLELVAALRDVDAASVAPEQDAGGPDAGGPDLRGAVGVLVDDAAPDAGATLLRPRDEEAGRPGVADLLAAPAGRPAGALVGYVPGGWDMFHVGHLRILQRARARCDRLVVGVVTDEALTAVKGRPPMVGFAERAAVVAAVGLVDEVVADTSAHKLRAWERVGFDVLFKGDDWRGTPKGDALEAEMATVGVEVRYFPYTPHTSSTALRSVLGAR